jgi:hypothetical protein
MITILIIILKKVTQLLGANEISRTTPAPLGDYLLGVYSEIFLENFEQNYFKKSF